MARGIHGLRTKISKMNLGHETFGTTRLPKVNRASVRRTLHDGCQKRDHLRNNAATVSATCVNGSRRGGLGLGVVGGDGEEVNEEIHWCDCVMCGWTDAIELF